MTYILFYLIPVFAGIAFLLSIPIHFRRLTETYLRFLSWYLLFDCVIEGITQYQALHTQNTVLLSNVSSVVSFCFYFYMLREIIHSKKARRVLLYSLLFYPLVFAINIFPGTKIEKFSTR